MIATTIASTAAGVYSSQQQKSLAVDDARARGRQAASEAREEEINRLDLFSQVASENMARMAAGGIAMEGTLADITQGNIATLEEDVEGIKASGAAQQAYYGQAAKNANTVGNLNMFTTMMQGASQMASVGSGINYTSTPTNTGVVTGVS